MSKVAPIHMPTAFQKMVTDISTLNFVLGVQGFRASIKDVALLTPQ
jgi:hypothetical protein